MNEFPSDICVNRVAVHQGACWCCWKSIGSRLWQIDSDSSMSTCSWICCKHLTVKLTVKLGWDLEIGFQVPFAWTLQDKA